MLQNKSPFFVSEEFLSPLLCEDILDLVDFTVPNTDKDGNNVITLKSSQQAEMIIFERLQHLMPTIEQHYDVLYKGTEPMKFEWIPPGAESTMGAENSAYVRGKWLRVKPADLTAIIFLSDYQNKAEFESEYEVYGGKLEFPQHQFGFNPVRGTLIVFPSDPHFINQSVQVHMGDLYQVRIQIVCKNPLYYQPNKFPGNYTTWFQ